MKDLIDIQKEIIETFIDMGIFVDIDYQTKECDLPVDLDLRDYIPDSITFISLIVELENKFEIDFPDELLAMDSLGSLSGFSYLLMEIINGRKEEKPNEEVIEETSS